MEIQRVGNGARDRVLVEPEGGLRFRFYTKKVRDWERKKGKRGKKERQAGKPNLEGISGGGGAACSFQNLPGMVVQHL